MHSKMLNGYTCGRCVHKEQNFKNIMSHAYLLLSLCFARARNQGTALFAENHCNPGVHLITFCDRQFPGTPVPMF
jgi:hypothetical protein